MLRSTRVEHATFAGPALACTPCARANTTRRETAHHLTHDHVNDQFHRPSPSDQPV